MKSPESVKTRQRLPGGAKATAPGSRVEFTPFSGGALRHVLGALWSFLRCNFTLANGFPAQIILETAHQKLGQGDE